MAGCGDVTSLESLQIQYKHQVFEAEVITGKAGGVAGGASIDYATNQVTGQTQQTLPSILVDLGFNVQSWTSSTGGVLASANQVFLNDTPGSLGIGDYYAWGGDFPKTVPAGTDPALPTSGYIMRSSKFAGTQAREALRRSYAEAGYQMVTGSFGSGGTVTTASQVLLFDSNGKGYSWGGALPKTVPLGSTPTNSGGIGPTSWIDVSEELGAIKLSATSESFFGKSPVNENVFETVGWRQGGLTGGAVFASDAVRMKADHDGIDFISPTVPPVSAQAGGTLAEREVNFRSGVGETDPSGVGVFVRVSPRDYREEDGGFSTESNILNYDTVSDDGVFCRRSASSDGILVASKTLVNGAEHVFDGAGRAFAVADNAGVRLSKHGEAAIPRLSGQIAQNVETFVTDGDRIYALAKGSYGLADSSILATYQLSDSGLVTIGSPVDLGVGADCRAMAMANGFLYVFKGPSILVFKTESYFPPTLIATVPRPNIGFVQTCSVINGLLVAPVWGEARIETYSINNIGIPVLHENFTVTAGNSNSSIVDAKDGSFLLIRHVSGTNALGRFHFDAGMKIVGMQFFTIAAMLQGRYGVVRNSKLYVGSYSSGGLLEIDLTSATPAVTRTFTNMASPVLYGNYLIGANRATGVNSAINLTSGEVYQVEGGLSWLYPSIYGDIFITFIAGDEAPEPGAAPNDSLMGQKIAVYKMTKNASLDLPKCPVVASLLSVSTGSNCESSYLRYGLSSGYNQLGLVRKLSALTYSWIELKVSGLIVDNQASGASAYKAFEGRAVLLYTAGTWTIKLPYTENVSNGTSTVTFSLSAGADLGFGMTAPSALAGAVANVKVELRSQNPTLLAL